MRDLRDPTAVGEKLLKAYEQWRFTSKPFTWVADRALLVGRPVPNYNANPGTIEKYGRPQDLPETPF